MAKKRKRKYSRSAQKDVESEMRRYKRGTAKSGRGGKAGKVKSRKQAVAIGLSEARKSGAKVPSKSSASSTVAGSAAAASKIPLPASVRAIQDLSAGSGRTVMSQSSHTPDSRWVPAAK